MLSELFDYLVTGATVENRVSATGKGQRVRRSFVAPLASLLLSSRAFAAGYEFPDNGAVAMGRAGAFAAKADDPTAIYYNPAGLAAQEGIHVLFDSHLLVDSISYQRTTAPNADGTTTNIGPEVSNGAG